MSKLLPILVICITIVSSSCDREPKNAKEIVDRSIEAYGGEKQYKVDIEFDFRDIHYRCYYDKGIISFERMFQSDSLGNVHDVLNNEGFTRKVNGVPVELDDEWTGKYTRSVNSVIYFFRIPFNLNDPAVNKKLLGETAINGKKYYEVLITFDKEGGGKDFEDSFVYWFNKETFFIDYFSYSYSTDGGGKRFRATVNPREVNGLLVVDYINYKPRDLKVPIEDFDQYFQQGGFEELSRIENKNTTVSYLK